MYRPSFKFRNVQGEQALSRPQAAYPCTASPSLAWPVVAASRWQACARACIKSCALLSLTVSVAGDSNYLVLQFVFLSCPAGFSQDRQVSYRIFTPPDGGVVWTVDVHGMFYHSMSFNHFPVRARGAGGRGMWEQWCSSEQEGIAGDSTGAALRRSVGRVEAPPTVLI